MKNHITDDPKELLEAAKSLFHDLEQLYGPCLSCRLAVMSYALSELLRVELLEKGPIEALESLNVVRQMLVITLQNPAHDLDTKLEIILNEQVKAKESLN